MTSISSILSVALGGALGCVGRYLIATNFATQYNFPWATLLVNILGSFVIGICFVLIQEKFIIAMWLKPFLVFGLLGGFTTFSAFSLDTLHLLEAQMYVSAMLNVGLSVGLSILAVLLGVYVTRLI